MKREDYVKCCICWFKRRMVLEGKKWKESPNMVGGMGDSKFSRGKTPLRGADSLDPKMMEVCVSTVPITLVCLAFKIN